MPSRSTYTTEWVRAEDLRNGDVARIGDTWSYIHDVYDESTATIAAEEFGDGSPTAKRINSITAVGTDTIGSTYVAVRYLRTSVRGTSGSNYRTGLSEPCFGIAAYSQYELVEVQKEVTSA